MSIEVAKLSDIAEGGLINVSVNGSEIVLGRYEGKIYAVEKRCKHMRASLNMGTLNGYILTCPLHHMQYDIRSGIALSGPIANVGVPIIDIDSMHLASFEVVLDNGKIKLEL